MCESQCFFTHSLIGSFIYLPVLGISREREPTGDGIVDRYIDGRTDKYTDIETGAGARSFIGIGFWDYEGQKSHDLPTSSALGAEPEK